MQARSSEDTCFYTPPGKTCEQFYQKDIPRACIQQPLESQSGSTSGASAIMREFYTSDKMLQQVADLFKQDFVAFGYPELTLADLHGGSSA